MDEGLNTLINRRVNGTEGHTIPHTVTHTLTPGTRSHTRLLREVYTNTKRLTLHKGAPQGGYAHTLRDDR